MKYTGSCHCQRVQYECDFHLQQPTVCNCSHCFKRNAILHIVDSIEIKTGKEELTRYTFNKMKGAHYFCKHCGVRAFGVGNDTPMGKMVGVNIGCLDGLTEKELSQLHITYVDGMNDKFESPEFCSHL